MSKRSKLRTFLSTYDYASGYTVLILVQMIEQTPTIISSIGIGNSCLQLQCNIEIGEQLLHNEINQNQRDKDKL